VDALTRRTGDLPEGGNERLSNMKQVVSKPHNLPEQLRISASKVPVQEPPLISHLLVQAYMNDPLPGKILKAIEQGDNLKEITAAECTKENGQVLY